MLVFRYYYKAVDDFVESGFLIRVSDLIDIAIESNDDENMNEYLGLVAIFEDELSVPSFSSYINNPTARTYFTLKGNRKFKKAINKVKEILYKKHGWEMISICQDIPEGDPRIVYQDMYQILLNEKNEESVLYRPKIETYNSDNCEYNETSTFELSLFTSPKGMDYNMNTTYSNSK